MEKITIARALKTIVLPDGKTVHEGDEFVYNFDFENAGEFEIIGEQNGKETPTPKQPEGNEDKDIPVTALTVEEMKAIRLKAKDLKIANWHTKGIKRLLSEIAEAEAKPADEITSETKETEAKNTIDEITLESEQSEVGDKEAVSVLETVEPDGQPDNTPAA